jgi:glycosyltransferase involved in cell wall biosynthesis
MTIFYFGADKTWQQLQSFGFRRRNTCIVKALSQIEQVNNIVLVRKTTITNFLRWLFSKRQKGKVTDIYFTSFLPAFCRQKLGMQKLDERIAAFCITTLSGVRNTPADIVWAYWPAGYRAASQTSLKGIRVFDADHNLISDPNIEPAQRQAQQALLLTIGKWSHIILSSVRSMINWYHSNGIEKGYRLRNGVEAGRFTHLPRTHSSSVTIGYCGTLSRWIDYDLFRQLIANNPAWNFVIVGKPYKGTDEMVKMLHYPNVTFLGERKADEVPAIMASFTVGINLYKFHPALDVDSMKLYEYIAAGVPVVSTSFHAWLKEDFEGLIYEANNLQQIEDAINNILLTQTAYDTVAQNHFLQKSSWHNRVLQFVQNLPNPAA